MPPPRILSKTTRSGTRLISNDEATFRDHVFAGQFQKALVSRHDRNQKVVFAYLDNKEMQDRGGSGLRGEDTETGHRRPPTNLSHR